MTHSVVVACMALLAGFAPPALAADPTREAHGSADIYAAPGVALAWGVLRGASEAETTVVLRIVIDPGAYPYVQVIGIDPFTHQRESRLPGTRVTGTIDVRVPRARFADFPRTELRLYGSAATLQADTPALIVFYLGVPDTAPEFADKARLETYLDERLRRAGGTAKGKTP